MRALTPREQQRCVGGHPLCGSETAGVGNARASLYDGATYFVTPGAHVDADAYQRLYGFLGQIGARPVAVDPDEHDRLMAVVSHLPHVLANVLMTQAGVHAGGPRRAAVGGPQLSRPHAHRRQQPARVDRHLPREPRRSAGRAGDLPGGPAGGPRGARRQRRGSPRRRYRPGRGTARAHARRGQPRRRASCTASSCASPTGPASSRRSWSALGDAGINIEDLQMHHMSAELGRHAHRVRARRGRGRARRRTCSPGSATT